VTLFRRDSLEGMRTAYIGMGGNVRSVAGSPEATLTAAVVRMGSLGRVACRSSLYSTEPVGYAEQPRFINAVVALETELEPRALLAELMAIEKEFGRDRTAGVANGPRTLDLDILLYDDWRVSEPGLEIPHPRLAERAFVLIPLRQIAPGIVASKEGRTVSQLLDSLFPHGENQIDAVVEVQSDGWRAGVGRGCADALEP
jgi:2-amino-4-hydroxy-6-hydroxymethyldihydropteridine diphosphokinase